MLAVAGLRPGFVALNQELLLLRSDRRALGLCHGAVTKNGNSKQTQQQLATAMATNGRLHAQTIQLKALWRVQQRNSYENTRQP